MKKAIKFSLFILIFVVCLECLASNYYDVDKSYAGAYGGLGGFGSLSKDYRAGGELAATFWHQNSAFRASGMIYSAESKEFESQLFAGYSLTAIAYVGDRLKSYIGLGAFLGENLDCDGYVKYDSRGRIDEDDDDRDCYDRSRVLFSLFPELGFALHWGPFQINPFVRVYFDTENQRGEREGNGVAASFGTLIHWEVF